jgi:hypothetical protein
LNGFLPPPDSPEKIQFSLDRHQNCFSVVQSFQNEPVPTCLVQVENLQVKFKAFPPSLLFILSLSLFYFIVDGGLSEILMFFIFLRFFPGARM